MFDQLRNWLQTRLLKCKTIFTLDNCLTNSCKVTQSPNDDVSSFKVKVLNFPCHVVVNESCERNSGMVELIADLGNIFGCTN